MVSPLSETVAPFSVSGRIPCESDKCIWTVGSGWSTAIPRLFGTDLPLGAADEAALVAVEVDGVGLYEEEVLVSLKGIESSDLVDDMN